MIQCEIIGMRKYSSDLRQGGLEVPCTLIFEGSCTDVSKVAKLIKDVEESKDHTKVGKNIVDMEVDPGNLKFIYDTLFH